MLGEVINNYEIKALLGEGGMGAVYLAEHPFIGRRAAIKVLRRELAQDAAMVERFMNEARAANAIRHPNIIDIIDVGRTQSGVPYLMMEFLDGISVSQRIADVGKLEIAEALEIAAQTAGALAAAHDKGIVHRDLKPDNLFLIPDPAVAGGTRVKVLDFGIAKLRGELTNLSARTVAGALMGTPPYMSPEQCRGLSDDIDHRTDIYALGIILYEMLCGTPPFVSQGWGEIVMAHMSAPPPPPRTRNAHITAAVEAAILKALAKERGARFADMAEFQAVLRAESPVPHFGGTAQYDSARASSQSLAQPAATPPAGRGALGATTTFRNAAAEVTPSAGLTKPAPRLALLSLGAAGAAVIVFAIAKLSLGRAPAREAATPRAPVVVEAPAPAPVSPPPIAEAPAPEPILIQLTSVPAGASVVNAADGAVLGTTPLERRVGRGDTPLALRVGKPGFANVDVSVPRDVAAADFQSTVRLERTRTKPRPAPAAPTTTSKPTPAATASTAPPSPSAPPPPAARRPEKW